jgi:hypothetical protein
MKAKGKLAWLALLVLARNVFIYAENRGLYDGKGQH